MTDPSRETIEAVLNALLRGAFSQWHGLPEGTTVSDLAGLYGSNPKEQSGRLSGHWFTTHDFRATKTYPSARVWSQEGHVVRIDLEKPGWQHAPEQLDRLGEPAETRLPPTGYRYDEEDELLEMLYPARGLVLHVSDPTLPGGSPTRRIVRARAFTPTSIAAYDRKLGGQQPGRIRRPNP